MIPFRHALASAREVVRPFVAGALPYVVAVGVVAGLAGFIWFGLGGEDSEKLPGDEAAAEEEVDAVSFEDALALVESGDVEGGRVAMRALAPLATARMGIPEAHDWLARDLLGLGLKEKTPSREAMGEAREHLKRLVGAEFGGAEVVALLVQVHLVVEAPERALALLDEEAIRLPELHLLGARVATSLRNPVVRERHAMAAAAYFSKVREDEGAGAEERVKATLGLAEAEGFLGRFESMRALAKSLPDEEGGKVGLVLQGWLGLIREGMAAGRPLSETVSQLGVAIEEIGPEVPLIELAAVLGAQDPSGVEIGKVYERLAAEETEDVACLVPLGSFALALRKGEAGLRFLERAVDLAPDHVVALNNLAFGLAERGGEKDVKRALELVDRAVAAARENGAVPVNCWETRGQILAKLGRWQEAVVDLERALTKMSGSKPVHATLGAAYRELGHGALAEEHLRLAE